MPSTNFFPCALLFYPSLNSFTWLPPVCPFIWLSSLCQSVPLSSILSLLPHSLQMTIYPISPFITSALCEFASCLYVFLLFSPWIQIVLYVSGLNVLFWFPFSLLFALPLPFLLFIYTEREWRKGMAVRMDWWMAVGHGWGDLGVWLTLLSLRIILTELAGSLLWKGPSNGKLSSFIKMAVFALVSF